MICKHCGAEISDGAKFCSKCGARVEPDSLEDDLAKFVMEVENDNDNEVRKFDVPQNSVGFDIEDRVVIGKRLIEELRTADK